MNKFNVGDRVRIKTVKELRAEGRYVSDDCAIAKWQNRLCIVEEIIYENRYMLLFADPKQNKEVWGPHMTVNDFIWEEENLDYYFALEEESLDYYEQHNIQTNLFESLIGGAVQ